MEGQKLIHHNNKNYYVTECKVDNINKDITFNGIRYGIFHLMQTIQMYYLPKLNAIAIVDQRFYSRFLIPQKKMRKISRRDNFLLDCFVAML